MTGDRRPDPLEILNSASIGPATNLARAFALASLALAGIVLLIVPSLTGAPLTNRILIGLGALAFLAMSFIGLFRYRRLVRRLQEDANRDGAVPIFAFLQAEIITPGAARPSFVGQGWVVSRGDHLDITWQSTLTGPGGTRSIALTDVTGVAYRKSDIMVFNRLLLGMRGEVTSTFVIAPTNGSGLRGATEDEVRKAIATIEGALPSGSG